MKKFYSTIALACAVGVSAFAASPVAEAPVKKTFESSQTANVVTTYSNGAKAAKIVKTPQKVAASIDDIEGLYSVEYESMFQSGAKDNGVTATITAVSDDQILIQMEPYCSGYSNMSMDPLIASYDASTGTITISVEDNSSLGNVTFSDGSEYTLELNAYNRVPDPNNPGKYVAEALDELVAVVQADGTIQFGDENTCFGFQEVERPGYYVGGFMNAKFVAPNFFKYVADEWESVGDALFTEDWLNIWLYEDDPDFVLQPRNIPLMRNKADDSLYLVLNPFKVNNWWNEDPDSDGYLVFSLQNAAMVPMRPLTPSGLWVTIQQGGFPQQFYMYNQEGYYIYNQGYTIEELILMFAEDEIVASDFDEATKTVTMRNLCFGYTDSPGSTTYFPAIEDGVYKIQSDALKVGGLGVNNIVTDESNGPKRFFNLQGVEISNPANGEIVIVKEGNKTSKVIVR